VWRGFEPSQCRSLPVIEWACTERTSENHIFAGPRMAQGRMHPGQSPMTDLPTMMQKPPRQYMLR